MGLYANGLKIKKGCENNLLEIVNLLSPSIRQSMISRSKKEFYNTYVYFLKYLEKTDWNKDKLVDLEDFYEKNVFLYVKKESLSLDYFSKPQRAEVFFQLMLSLFSSEFLSYNSFKLKILPTKKEKKVLILLPFDFDLSEMNKDVLNYCDIYSATNKSDDVPSHFNDYDEVMSAVDDWYDIDDSNLFLSYDVKVDLNLIDWFLNSKILEIFPKASYAHNVYKKDWYKGTEEDILDDMDALTELVSLKKDNYFMSKVYEEMERDLKRYDVIHQMLCNSMMRVGKQ